MGASVAGAARANDMERTMATIHTMNDLIRILEQHPEWRAEVRRLVLSGELLALPKVVEGLATHMDQLTVLIDQLGARMADLTVRIDQLGARLDHVGELLEQLAHRVDALVESHQRLIDDVGGLKGKALEAEYRDRAPSYFGRLVRKGRVVEPNELWDALEASLTADELSDAILADVLIRGGVRDHKPATEVVLVVEVSFVLDLSDVERARRRCALLRRAGLPAIAVVAGERATDTARVAAEEASVVILERHRPSHWDLALRDLAA